MFMGGTDEDIAAFRTHYSGISTVRIIGRKMKRAPALLAGCRCAVLPNSAEDVISVQYTSPLKLFGYMAAGVPIVASDLPSIREILSDDMAFFCTPDSPEALAAAIQQAVADPKEAHMRAERARLHSNNYGWDTRAKSILAALAHV